MPSGIAYRIDYLHKRKEVVIKFQVGSTPPIEIVMSAEGFLNDLEFIKNDKHLAHLLSIIKERKDLPIDHDFGPSGGDTKFDPREWEDKMGGSHGEA